MRRADAKNRCLAKPALTGAAIVRERSTMPKTVAVNCSEEPAKFCFRYRGGRGHRRLYDVLVTLNEPGGVCHIEVWHAMPKGADLPLFASGRLNAARLTRASELIGLVKQVTSRDHTRLSPGHLVFDAHMQLPWRPVTIPATTRTQRTARSSAGRHALSAFRAPRAPVPSTVGPTAQPLAHLRIRYPLHGLGRGGRLKRLARAG